MDGRQKQVDDAIQRCFTGRPPSGKVKVVVSTHSNGQRTLELHHYQHRLLLIDLATRQVLYSIHGESGWKRTDFRILKACLLALDAMSAAELTGAGGAHSGTAPRIDTWGTQPEARRSVRTIKRSLPRNLGEVTVAIGTGVVEKGSRFVAAVAFPCATEAHAQAALALLRRLGDLGGATHRISAWRAAPPSSGRGKPADGFDDDGETRGGSSLRAAMRKERVVGAAAVVARWYGGENIGKARFRHIQERAITAFRAAGHVPGHSLSEAAYARYPCYFALRHDNSGRRLCKQATG